MPQYHVTALGGEIDELIEADSRSKAEKKALDALKADFRGSVSSEKLSVYTAVFTFDGGKADVLAASEREAENNAEGFIKRKRERALAQLRDNQDARDLLSAMKTTVEIRGPVTTSSYQIDRHGRWNEGELDD